jgi:hypothetical protein
VAVNAVAALLRGSGVAAVTTSLAVAAHATGGAMVPGLPALLLLGGLGAALGAAAGTLPWVRSSQLGLLGLLGVGQVAGHLLLWVTAINGHICPSSAMLAAHAGAVLVAAVLVVIAERVGPACVSALRRVLPALPVPLVVRRGPVHLPVSVTATPIRRLLVTTSLARRGPPVGA